MAQHQWQCKKCGKKSAMLSSGNSNPNPLPIGGKCPSTTSGQHISVKIR